jgi:predicted AlkP superfamily pyrophosphatase or phosphodiesterase
VTCWNSDHIPEETRKRIATFVAPPMHAFEDWRGPKDSQIPATGVPHCVFSHGLRPGDPADDRIMIVSHPAGSGIVVDAADPNQFTPTLAALLGLPLQAYWPAPVAH